MTHRSAVNHVRKLLQNEANYQAATPIGSEWFPHFRYLNSYKVIAKVRIGYILANAMHTQLCLWQAKPPALIALSVDLNVPPQGLVYSYTDCD